MSQLLLKKVGKCIQNNILLILALKGDFFFETGTMQMNNIPLGFI